MGEGRHANQEVGFQYYSKRVLTATLLEDRACVVNIMDYKDAVTTTLGLQWNSTEDMFVIPAARVPDEYATTKQNVLKKITTVFDPLSLVSLPLFKQKLCFRSCGPEGRHSLHSFKVPSCLHTSVASTMMAL